MLKKSFAFAACLLLMAAVLCFPLTASASDLSLSVSQSDIVNHGSFSSGNLVPGYHVQNVPVPQFAASPSAYFTSFGVTGSTYNFVFNDFYYSLSLPSLSQGHSVVPFAVWSLGETLVIAVRDPGASSYFSVVSDYVICHCFAYFRFNIDTNGNIVTSSIFYSETSGIAIAKISDGSLSAVNAAMLYCDAAYPVPSYGVIYAVNGVVSSTSLYNQPCLSRWGYWLNGVHTYIFTQSNSSAMPVLMYRAGDYYFIVSCRYADYETFKLYVSRSEVDGRYLYTLSTSHVYSVFQIPINDPTNWVRVSTNNPAGVFIAGENRFFIVANSFPVSFESHIDNVFAWSNPNAFCTFSSSPNYIPSLGENIQDFDELEGNFLNNAQLQFDRFWQSVEDTVFDMSKFYSAFSVWQWLVGALVVNDFYMIVFVSLACGLMMLMLNLFTGVFSSGKSDREYKSSSDRRPRYRKE